MRHHRLSPPFRADALVLALCVALATALSAAPALGQGAVGGVAIDPQGMLRETRAPAAAPPRPTEPTARPSTLRYVSLRRLEAQLERLRASGEALPPDVRHLAGLTSITRVFRFPSEGGGGGGGGGTADVVLAGPADPQGTPGREPVARDGGPPLLHLDDLAVALRYAFDETPTDAFLGCSIDPAPEGTVRYAAYVRRHSAQLARGDAAAFLRGLEQAAGPQSVSIYGVPPESHFALTMLAADYRLKRIALGADPAPDGVTSYLDLAARRAGAGGGVRQHRWWFVGALDGIVESSDRRTIELRGTRLKVIAAASAPGLPMATADETPDADAAAFADAFTRNFDGAARQTPVLAELANLVGLAVIAELIAEPHFANAADAATHWEPAVLLDDRLYPIARGTAPRFVPPLTRALRVDRRTWILATSGGVSIAPLGLASPRQTSKSLTAADEVAARRPVAEDHWWWD